MSSRHQNATVIDLFPVRHSDGGVRYAAWPEAAALLVFDGLAKLASKHGKLLLAACGVAVLLLARSSEAAKQKRG